MAEVRDVAWAPIETPPPRPVTSLGQVSPASRQSFAYLTGQITGSSLNYPDLWAFAWYLPLIADPDDRIRSNIAETTGDVLVGLQAVDVSAGEAFLRRQLTLGEAHAFADAIDRNRTLYAFFPRRKHMVAGLDDYAYETKLARLNRTYPPSVLIEADEVDEYETSLTAGEWLEWLFEQWAELYPWFTFKPVPELYLRRATGDYTGDAGLVFSEALSIIQDEDNPRSMRSIIDEFMEIFDGHLLRVDADNDFVILPPFWSPAYDGGMLELDSFDLYELPEPEEDAEAIINQATVRSQGFEFVEDQAVMVPGCSRKRAIRHDIDFDSEGPPIACNGFESVGSDVPSADVHFWPVADEVLPGVSTLTITLNAVVRYKSGLTDDAEAHDITVTPDQPEHELPMDGQWHQLVRVEGSALTALFGQVATGFVSVRALYDHERRGVWLWYHDMRLSSSPGGTPDTALFSFKLELNGDGTAWARSDIAATGTFGLDEVVPGLQESRDQFGVVERQIRSDFFQLTNEQCLQIAEGIVVNHKDPQRRYRELEQSAWRAFPVKPEHIGRRIRLPNEDLGVVEAWSYMDAFEYASALVRSTLTAVVADPLVDPDVDYLFNPDGTFWVNPDNTLSPVP